MAEVALIDNPSRFKNSKPIHFRLATIQIVHAPEKIERGGKVLFEWDTSLSEPPESELDIKNRLETVGLKKLEKVTG